MRPTPQLAALIFAAPLALLLTATSLQAKTPDPGPPPPPGCPRDLQKAQANLATSQDNLTKCQADAAKNSANSPNDELAKAQAKLNDWPQLQRYAAGDAALPPAGN